MFRLRPHNVRVSLCVQRQQIFASARGIFSSKNNPAYCWRDNDERKTKLEDVELLWVVSGRSGIKKETILVITLWEREDQREDETWADTEPLFQLAEVKQVKVINETRSKANPPHLSFSCLRHGTVFLMQVPLRGSTSSTMTNGASSRVTMDRWSSRSSTSEYSSKRGHTWYLMVKEPRSHFPTCVGWEWMRAVWGTGSGKIHFLSDRGTL